MNANMWIAFVHFILFFKKVATCTLLEIRVHEGLRFYTEPFASEEPIFEERVLCKTKAPCHIGI